MQSDELRNRRCRQVSLLIRHRPEARAARGKAGRRRRPAARNATGVGAGMAKSVEGGTATLLVKNEDGRY